MFTRILFLVLAVVLIPSVLVAETPALPDAPSATKAKLQNDLNKFAAEQKKVTVRFTDSKKLSGKVQDITEEGFVLTDAKTGQPTRVNFDDVDSVKKAGMSTGTKVLIGVAVAVGFSMALTGIQCARGAISC